MNQHTLEVKKPDVLLPVIASAYNNDLTVKPEFHITYPVAIPVMHHQAFAEHIGLSVGVVRGWVNSGYLDTIKVGRYDLINLAKLNSKCLEV